MAYGTPRVYVEEISVFPPSVAEVETALPAFIGYTASAKEFAENDLRNVPTRIRSLLEFEGWFGKGPEPVVDEVIIDENNVVVEHKTLPNYFMYDALRLFFENGGGKCYIVSVGAYGDWDKAHFESGLAALRKQDEPTIILFRDAVRFEGSDLYDLQTQALKQCSDLQDRFAVFDLIEKKTADPTFDWADGVDEFRENIGTDYLKYGAAYTRWLQAKLPRNLGYRDVRGKATRGGVSVDLAVGR